MKGYEKSEKIEKEINDLLKNNPITSENALEWMNFSRTIRSGLEIIEKKAMDEIDKDTERVASQTHTG